MALVQRDGDGVSLFNTKLLRTFLSFLQELSKARRVISVKGNRYRHVVCTEQRELLANLGGTAENIRPNKRIDFFP